MKPWKLFDPSMDAAVDAVLEGWTLVVIQIMAINSEVMATMVAVDH